MKRLVLVVGVGRSGTSLLAGILGQLGFHIPQPEVTADDTNPQGLRRAALGRRLPHAADAPAARDRLRRAARRLGEDGRGRPTTAGARSELRDWLPASWPRPTTSSSRTRASAGSWTSGAAACDELGARTSQITMLRHPAEILTSARALLRHLADRRQPRRRVAERDARDRARDARRQRASTSATRTCSPTGARRCTRAGAALDLPLLADIAPERAAAVDAFVDPSLHRSRVGWEGLEVPRRVRDLCERGLGPVRAPGRGRGRRARRSTPRCERYRALYGEAEAIAQPSVTAVRPRKAAGPAAAADAAREGRPPHPEARPRAPAPPRRSLMATHQRRRPRLQRRGVPRRVPDVARCARRSRDLEILIVDDGSTDGSAQIAAAATPTRDDRVPAHHAAQRRPRRGAQHRHRGRDRRVPRVPGLRRRAAADRLRAAARLAGEDRLGLRHRQRAPAHRARAPSRRRSCARAFARDRRQDARHGASGSCSSDRIVPNKLWRRSFWERARLPLPRGDAARGHPGRHPRAVHGAQRRRHLRARLPLPRPRGRRPVDHPAPRREARAARPPEGRRAGARLPRRARRPARRTAGTRRASSPRTCATTSTSSRSPTTSTARSSSSASTRSSTGSAGASVLQAAAGDRPAEVAPRPPPADARAARGAALPARGPARHAAGARCAGAGTATTRTAPTGD